MEVSSIRHRFGRGEGEFPHVAHSFPLHFLFLGIRFLSFFRFSIPYSPCSCYLSFVVYFSLLPSPPFSLTLRIWSAISSTLTRRTAIPRKRPWSLLGSKTEETRTAFTHHSNRASVRSLRRARPVSPPRRSRLAFSKGKVELRWTFVQRACSLSSSPR